MSLCSRGMARPRVILQSDHPYNIGARCINREWFNIPMPEVWEIFCDELTQTHNRHKMLIHSFVLMSNHYHLIASTPQSNISQCMHYFMSAVSRRLTRAGNRINETFAGRHFKTILQSPSYFLCAYKYNYRNPVTAQICGSTELYPFSTLRGVINPTELKIPLVEDSTFQSDPNGTLKWLNTSPDPEKLEAVRWGLKRSYFRSKKNRITNRPIFKEDDVL